jgi:hypothetical protein
LRVLGQAEGRAGLDDVLMSSVRVTPLPYQAANVLKVRDLGSEPEKERRGAGVN